MPLNAVTLGEAINNVRMSFSNKTKAQLEANYGTLDEARKQMAIQEAQVIINHFQANALLNVPGTGLVAGQIPVTGTSITGTIQ